MINPSMPMGRMPNSNMPIKLFVPALYRFLRALIFQWTSTMGKGEYPLVSIQKVLYIWDTFMRPWESWTEDPKYGVTDNRVPVSNDILSKWKSYILANWCFYTNLIGDVLKIMRYHSWIAIMADANRSNELKALADFFTRFEVVIPLVNGLSAQVDSYIRNQSNRMGRSNADSFLAGPALVLHIKQVEDSLSNYRSILSLENTDCANAVMNECAQIIAEFTDTVPEKKPQKEGFFNSLLGTDEVDRDYLLSIGVQRTIKQQVETIYKSLGRLFVDRTVDFDKELLQTKQRINQSPKKIQERALTSIYQVERQDKYRLTEDGRNSLAYGKKMCDHSDIPFFGDPMYRMPPGEFEIAWLIPYLLHYSTKINKWIDRRIYDKDNLSEVGVSVLEMLNALLSPTGLFKYKGTVLRAPSDLTHSFTEVNEVHVDKIHVQLRVFADYRNWILFIGPLLIMYVLLWFIRLVLFR
jgi:hypothetical protein